MYHHHHRYHPWVQTRRPWGDNKRATLSLSPTSIESFTVLYPQSSKVVSTITHCSWAWAKERLVRHFARSSRDVSCHGCGSWTYVSLLGLPSLQIGWLNTTKMYSPIVWSLKLRCLQGRSLLRAPRENLVPASLHTSGDGGDCWHSPLVGASLWPLHHHHVGFSLCEDISRAEIRAMLRTSS